VGTSSKRTASRRCESAHAGLLHPGCRRAWGRVGNGMGRRCHGPVVRVAPACRDSGTASGSARRRGSPPARTLPRSGQPRWTAHRMRWSRRWHRAARRPTFAKRVSSPGGRFYSEHSDNGIFGGHGNGGIARPPLRPRSPWLGPRSLPRVLPRRRIILGFHRDVARRESTSKSGVKAVAALNDCLFQIPTSTSGGPPIANLSLPQPNRSRHPERALASSR